MSSAPILTLTGLSKAFGAVAATDQLDLNVFDGEVHALIGPNGAGKTTLIAQVSGEVQPDRGSISFLGEEITRLTIQQRVERGLSRSFQVTSIFPRFSVAQNVALAVQCSLGHSFRFFKAPESDKSLLAAARGHLKSVGLESRATVPAAQLAHGEQRQLEIAMALALRPKLILLDEPMAGMGREESRRMLSLLLSLKGRFAMLLVEHDIDVVFALSDRVTVMVYGKALASGKPAEIQVNAAVREAYLGGK